MNDVVINLHARQSMMVKSKANEILYGGAAGGGKSYGMRAIATMLCTAIDGLNVYLFRRLSDDLKKNHLEGAGGLYVMLAPWLLSGHVRINEQKNEVQFWNGSKIFLSHCQHEKDKYKYQGAEIHVLLIDELTHFTESIYRYLRGRLRLGELKVPDNLKGKLPLALCGSNPGGVGHQWVKNTFVTFANPFEIKQADKKGGGMLRQYIPAKLEDNPTMLINDPDYADKLEGLGAAHIVRAMKEGDWDIVAGAFFADDWRKEKHVIAPFHIPLHWKRWRAMDWGTAAPYSIGWYCQDEEGLIYRYRELYGSKHSPDHEDFEPNTGTRETAKEVALKIKGIEAEEVKAGIEFRNNPADSSIWAKIGHEKSIYDEFKKVGIKWIKSDKGPGSRVSGANMCTQALRHDMFKVFDTCVHFIRTIPVLPIDEDKPEDVDTKAEDHVYDEWSYSLRSRHITRELIKEHKPKPLSMDWMERQR